jgi:uncharacterized membrane protein
MQAPDPQSPPPGRPNFGDDFRRFFIRGLATLMPTLVTIWLILKLWEFLWGNLGQPILWLLIEVNARFHPDMQLGWWRYKVGTFWLELIGVLLAILVVYMVGLLVGHFLGRAAWRLVEFCVMRIPFVRAIYPAVKQVTDFVLADRKVQFTGSRVVAVQPHTSGIWSVGLVTGPGIRPLSDTVGTEMVTVFIPSSPTAFSGYVVIVPRENVVDLPLTVEELMRLLVTGGVSMPNAALRATPPAPETVQPAGPQPLPFSAPARPEAS